VVVAKEEVVAREVVVVRAAAVVRVEVAVLGRGKEEDEVRDLIDEAY